MTREEAKSNIRCLLEIGGSDGFDYKEREAFDMAIEALERETCTDAISRQAVLDLAKFDGRENLGSIIHAFDVEQLPPVKPTEKMGHWITKRTIMHDGEFYCDVCDNDAPFNKTFRFCPNCGAKMQEVEE